MDRRVVATVASLEEGWRQQYCVADLAAKVNLAPSRLQHLFKATMKMSIREHVRKLRLHAAAHRIASSFDRISEIGYSVGFRDMSNFNHAFRREFGMSPREYRRQKAESTNS